MNREEATRHALATGLKELPEKGEYIHYGFYSDVFCALIVKRTPKRIEAFGIQTYFNGDEKYYFLSNEKMTFTLRKDGTWKKVGYKDMWSRLSNEPYTYWDPNF